MKSIWAIGRNSIGLLCLFLLLYSCTSTEKRTPKTYTVEIKQMQFQPAEITVQKGDTILWMNHDMVAHDVTEYPDKVWTSGPLPPDKSWSMVAAKSVNYYCSIHMVMKGKIIVQ